MESKYVSKLDKEERKTLARGAKAHIKSILRGLKKFEEGSRAEGQYLAEHLDKLDNFYLKFIINYYPPKI